MDAGPSSQHLPTEDSTTPASPTTAGHGALYDKLLRTGWCPHTIVIILKSFSIETAAHLFSLPRMPPALRDHSECTQTRCTANDTQLAEGGTYNSAHWKSCSGPDCAFLGPNPQEVREIIESGGIPLLSINKDDEGLLQVGVVRATVHSRFIAVSHVWSGGLGNPHDNSLPECQLRRLFDMWPELTREGEAFETFWPDHSPWHRQMLDLCREELADRGRFRASVWLGILFIIVLGLPLGYCIFAVRWAVPQIKIRSRSLRPAKILFWIDTICIPVGENYHPLKMQAINRMAKTYADAQGIVILDHELQQTKHKSMTSFEIMGLLACSAWMSRCWTFQEAAFAKYWLVQSKDGIWCPDLVLLREDFSSGRALAELRDFFLSVPRLRTEDGVRDFGGKSFKSRRNLFIYVWNALCNRSTTKREDLISIISNLLGFRPAEILRIPEENRLPSLFCADDVLPLTLLCRDRPYLTNWSEASQWLPSTIEEIPLARGGGMLWRRADQENFFVFKFGSYTSWNARLYFCRTPGEHHPPTLSLLDEDTGENLKIYFQLADDMILLPELDVCIIFFGFESYSDSKIVSGACLGVRYRGDGFRQLYYLCPVECFISPSKTQVDEVEGVDVAAKVKREDLAGLTEFAIEYDFSMTSTLSESRPLNGMIRKEVPVICIFPLCVYIACYYLFLTTGRGFDSSFWDRWWTGLPKREAAYFVIYGLRSAGFLLETYFLWRSLRKAEFEGWYSTLYEDGTIPQHASLYIHYRPLIVYCILGIGLVSWPIYLLLESLLPEWPILREIILVVCEGEVGLLLLKWLLELYVLAAPRIINLPVLMAQTSSPLTTPDVPMSWIFKSFYAKSRLTRVIEGGLEWVYLVVRSRFSNPGASDFLDCRSRMPTTDIPPETSYPNVKKPSSQPPWEHNDVKIFELSTKAQSLRFKNSISALTPRKYADGHFDEASQYLSEALTHSRMILWLYWLVILLIVESKRAEVDDKKQVGSRKDKIVTIIRMFGRIMALITTALALHGISAGYLKRPTHASPNARFSVHFGVTTTTLLLSTCCPLAGLLVFASSLPPLVAASSICAALIIGGLALLWFVELMGPRYAESFYRFDKGQEAVEECYRRVYAESRFTRWVKRALRPLYVGSGNWRRLFAAWRQHPEPDAAGNEDDSRETRIAPAAYTDDLDPEGDLIQLEREDE